MWFCSKPHYLYIRPIKKKSHFLTTKNMCCIIILKSSRMRLNSQSIMAKNLPQKNKILKTLKEWATFIFWLWKMFKHTGLL